MEERKYTALSGRAWERIAGQDMSPSEAVRYFSQDLCPRTFGEVLSGLMARQGLDREALIGRLWALRGGDIQRESVRRRVSMWLSAAQPAEREELFQLCFALGLDETAAHAFLRCTQDGDFHLREPREAGYLYGLRAGRTYGEVRSLLDRLGWADGPFPRETDGGEPVYTRTVADAFALVRTDDDFLAFCQANRDRFGSLHNTAYRYFTRFFDALTDPDAPLGAEEDESYSIERVVDLYLRPGLPSGRKTAGLTAAQKAVKRLWPNATAIKNMRARKLDVTRKVLLLLYLVTEGLDDGAMDEAMGWEPASPAERLEEHTWDLDLMLHECGMSPLDPRNPFDWLILYSLRSDGEEEAMRDRLTAVLTALFPGQDLDGGGDLHATLESKGGDPP